MPRMPWRLERGAVEAGDHFERVRAVRGGAHRSHAFARAYAPQRLAVPDAVAADDAGAVHPSLARRRRELKELGRARSSESRRLNTRDVDEAVAREPSCDRRRVKDDGRKRQRRRLRRVSETKVCETMNQAR